MQVSMTFNRPAVLAFFGESVDAVRVRVEGPSHISIKPVPSTTKGRDVFPLQHRTRGGAGIVVTGSLVDRLLHDADVEKGTHIKLERGTRNWISGEAVGDKLSKVVPTARVWGAKEE